MFPQVRGCWLSLSEHTCNVNKTYKNLQAFPARPVSCMCITGNSESCNVTHAFNGILSLGGFMKEMIIFDFLRRSLKKSEGLVECHRECNTSKVLSVEK